MLLLHEFACYHNTLIASWLVKHSNLSGCELEMVPAAIGQLTGLKILYGDVHRHAHWPSCTSLL